MRCTICFENHLKIDMCVCFYVILQGDLSSSSDDKKYDQYVRVISSKRSKSLLCVSI